MSALIRSLPTLWVWTPWPRPTWWTVNPQSVGVAAARLPQATLDRHGCWPGLSVFVHVQRPHRRYLRSLTFTPRAGPVTRPGPRFHADLHQVSTLLSRWRMTCARASCEVSWLAACTTSCVRGRGLAARAIFVAEPRRRQSWSSAVKDEGAHGSGCDESIPCRLRRLPRASRARQV
jgi:hypothetical protein